jgi:hypothetical protein
MNLGKNRCAMKKTMHIIASLIGIFLLFANAEVLLAQENTPPPPLTREQALEQLKDLRRQLLTEKLGLAENEVSAFVPVYEEFREKENKIALDFRAKYRKVDVSQFTEEQAKAYLLDLNAMKTAQHQLRQTYYDRFLTLIPAKKLVLLPAAEKEIQHAVLRRAREMRHQGKPGKSGDHQGRPHPPLPPPAE